MERESRGDSIAKIMFWSCCIFSPVAFTRVHVHEFVCVAAVLLVQYAVVHYSVTFPRRFYWTMTFSEQERTLRDAIHRKYEDRLGVHLFFALMIPALSCGVHPTFFMHIAIVFVHILCAGYIGWKSIYDHTLHLYIVMQSMLSLDIASAAEHIGDLHRFGEPARVTPGPVSAA